MKAFSQLLDRLVLTPSRNGKLQLLRDYFAETPDPDRGLALAALTGRLDIASIKPAMLRNMMAERMDDILFRLSYDYVGDLAETISLVWDSERHTATAASTAAATRRRRTRARVPRRSTRSRSPGSSSSSPSGMRRRRSGRRGSRASTPRRPTPARRRSSSTSSPPRSRGAWRRLS